MHLSRLLNFNPGQWHFKLLENFLFHWNLFPLLADVQENIKKPLQVFWSGGVFGVELDRVKRFRLVDNALIGLVILIGKEFVPALW